MWRKSVQPIIALPDITDNGWLATGEITWKLVTRIFHRKSRLFYVMIEIKKISMKNMKKELYLKKTFKDAKLIVMMTMTFSVDETLVLYA